MTQATKTPKEDRDMIARLADRGEQTIAKLADLPGGTKALKAVNDLRERVDELGKKVARDRRDREAPGEGGARAGDAQAGAEAEGLGGGARSEGIRVRRTWRFREEDSGRRSSTSRPSGCSSMMR